MSNKCDIDYECLFLAISRATLMSGASVLSGSAIDMNGCCIINSDQYRDS